MFALAFEHEVARQLAVLEELSTRLRLSGKIPRELSQEIEKWIRRVRQTRTIFTSLTDEDSRRKRQRFNAKAAIEQFSRQSEPFLSGATITFADVDDDMALPTGTFAEWSAVFQNLVVNAANAMVDKRHRTINVTSTQTSRTATILIQYNGTGVDLKEAERLFEPFERRTKISVERRALSVGGTGLGLTIVRLIARNLGFSVSFVRPKPGFSTCLKVEWQEKD